MDDPASVRRMDAGLNATFSQLLHSVNDFAGDGLSVAAGVPRLGLSEHIGHVGAQVAHDGAIAEQTLEFIGELEPSVC